MRVQPGALMFSAFVALSPGATSLPASESIERLVHVSSNGQDISPGGDVSTPCRSISFGILNADPGDVILVSPGRYGDLDRDGALGGPGEETGEVGFGCLCILKVDKSVRIFSTHGAAVTVIDASGMSGSALPVLITAPNTQFGRLEHGFLLKAQSNFTAVLRR